MLVVMIMVVTDMEMRLVSVLTWLTHNSPTVRMRKAQPLIQQEHEYE